MDLQKGVDPSQIKLEKGGGGGATAGATAGCLKHWVVQLVLVVFVLGNVTALYVLHFVNRPSPTTRFTFTNFEATTGLSPQEGDAVSFSSSSTLRNGAGTTAYLSTLNLTDGDSYDYINFAPLGTSKTSYATNIMSYRRTIGSTKASVLTTFTVDCATKMLTPNSISAANTVESLNIRGLATLSDSMVVVMTASEDSPYPTYITPATVSGTGVEMIQSKRVALVQDSFSNFLSPLTSSAFVVAHYDAYTTTFSQRVKVGVVDSTTYAITYSADTPSFGPDNDATSITNFGKPLAVASTTGATILIPYFTSTSVASQVTGLCVTKATFTSSTKAVSTFSTGVCQTRFLPAYLIDSIMLSDSAMAIAFYDEGNDNALTIATVVISSYDGSLSFRSSYVLSEVGGDFEWGATRGYSPKPSLAKLGGSRLAVSFLNPSQSGAMSVKILRYSSETLAFKDVTPVLPVAKKDFSLVVHTGKSQNPITIDLIATSEDGVVAAYMGNRDGTAHQSFSVVEDFGEPVGIIRKYNGKTKATVAISGKVEVSDLVVGEVYYATTTGAVMQSNGVNSGGDYTYSADGRCLMTANSKIGLAVESDQLFVNTAL